MKKKDFVFIILIFIVLLIVFFDLFTLQKSFLGGDHREQQYPWAKFYQQEIRQFHLPWWTRHIHCGFPLLAEGQVGAFYPLNFLFLFFLPIKWAYNYEILFHYFLGALLFFVYLRRHRISHWGAFFASLIYLFGSSQGGYFYYNLISQKVVIWLPLTLIGIDRLLEKRSWVDAFLLALTFSIQIFGGYLQVAIYSIFYSSLYFIYQWARTRDGRSLVLFLLSGILAVFFSLVQLLPTFELSLLSSRATAMEGLAYLGSLNPLGLLTLFYPSWDSFLGSEFYVGILGLFFVLVALFSKKETNEKFFILATVVFLLLALGRFSPLYTFLVKATHFYAFRTPIKFLFFVSFSCATLAAYGFDKFFLRKGREKSGQGWFKKAHRIFLLLTVILSCVPSLAGTLLSVFRLRLLPILQDYTAKHVFGKPGHPYALDYYLRKAVAFYDSTLDVIRLTNRDTFIEWVLLLFFIIFVTWLVLNKPKSVRMKGVCCLVLFVDLFLYGFTSIKGNYEPFDSIDSKKEKSKIIEYLKSDKSIYRVMEVYQDPTENRKFPCFPNFNMLYSIDDIGAYSPLVMRDYRSFLSGWGYTNDSISTNLVQPKNVLAHLKTLSLMNVKYLLSAKPLSHSNLAPVVSEEGITLYKNQKAIARAFFLPHRLTLDSLDDVKASVPVSVRFENHTKIKIDFQAPEPGLLVLTEMAYPQWTVRLNGNESSILRVAKLFRGVLLQRGRNEIIFEYRPVLFERFGYASLVLGFLLLGIWIFQKVSPSATFVKRNASK